MHTNEKDEGSVETGDFTLESEYEYTDDEFDVSEIAWSNSKRPRGNLKTTGLDDEYDKPPQNDAAKELPPSSLVCQRCERENHTPISDCQTIADWERLRLQYQTAICIDPELLLPAVSYFIRECANRFGVPEARAEVLCLEHGWDMDRMPRQDRTWHQPAELHAFRTLVETVYPIPRLAIFQECAICLDQDIPADQLVAAECGHTFCSDCWGAYLENALGDALVELPIACASHNCPQPITHDCIQRLAPRVLPVYEQHRLDSFVRGNSPESLRFCPGANCGWIVCKFREGFFDDNLNTTNPIHCENCGAKVQLDQEDAPGAGGEKPRPSSPLGQEDATGVGHGKPAAAVEAGPAEGGTTKVASMPEVYIPIQLRVRERLKRKYPDPRLEPAKSTPKKLVTKKCPRCKVEIEKISGCNRMTCKCGHPFCWLCGADYLSYGSHFCGNAQGNRDPPRRIPPRNNIDLDYVSRALTESPKATSKLARNFFEKITHADLFQHYFDRFFAHGQGQLYAHAQCPCLESRVNDFTQVASFKSGTDVDFFEEANQTLVASRRLLKYTYCSAFYYVRENGCNFHHVGFLQLEQLERFTEELSEVSENALTSNDRTRVIDLISVVKRCMRAVADFEMQQLLVTKQHDSEATLS